MTSSVQIIPTDPEYVPPEKATLLAWLMVREFAPQVDAIRMESHSHVQFIWAGENLQDVTCPHCGTSVHQGKFKGWWIGALDDAYQNSFSNLTVTLPCCSMVSSLNDLIYDMPQGFARFMLELEYGELNEGQVSELEQVLGCKLRQVWKHT